MMTLEQVGQLLHPLEFTIDQRVKVYPQNTDCEPEQGIAGVVTEIYVVDDFGLHSLEELEEVDNERLGSVYYLGIEFDPTDPKGWGDCAASGLYYVWELEAA